LGDKRPTFIDLFAGAGGMSHGFVMQGYNPLYANDHEKPALATYSANNPSTVVSNQDIEIVYPTAIRKAFGLAPGKLDLLTGGPPCQGFSTYGQRNVGDTRNQLYQHFIGFLAEFRPKAFVMENVVGLLSIEGGRIIDDILVKTSKLGYEVQVVTLDAADFGVPQFRKRVFVLGGTGRQKISTPCPTHSTAYTAVEKVRKDAKQTSFWEEVRTEPIQRANTVRDAISDLPREVLTPKLTQASIPYPTFSCLTPYQVEMREGSDSVLYHSAKQMLGIRRLRLTLMRPGDYGNTIRSRIAQAGLPNDVIDELLSGGGSLRDVSLVRSEDRVKEGQLRELLQQGHVKIEEVLAFLNSGGFANKYRRLEWDSPSHTLVAHMARDCSDFVHPDIDRFISVREAARLQSFPDRYLFLGSQFQQLRQIGNAVPPKLSEAIATEVSNFLGYRFEAAS